MKPAAEGLGIPYETEATQPQGSIYITSIFITQDNPNPTHEKKVLCNLPR